MIILKIIGWIVAILALLLVLILLLSVDVLLQSDETEGFRIKIRILGMTFSGNPHKEKKPEGAFVKAIKESLGISHLGSVESAKQTIEKKGFADTVTETVEHFMMLLDRVLWLVKRCRVPHCRITAVSGGEEAALDYGIACAVLYPLTTYLQEKMKLNPKKLRLEIACDHTRAKGAFELDLVVRVHIFHVLQVLLHIVKKNVEKEVERV